MMFLPGHPCPSCGEVVYGIDDVFTVLPRPGTEKLQRFRPGLYHYDCFLLVSFRSDYLSLCEADTKRYLKEKAGTWPILREDANYALVLKPVVKWHTLFFLRQGREISFYRDDQLEEFRRLVLKPDDWLKPTEPGARYMVLYQSNGWTVAEKENVEIGIEFPVADFAKIEKLLGLKEGEVPNLPIDMGRVCKQAGVTPLYIGCPLERAKGLIRRVERSEQRATVLLTLAVDHWKKVALSFDAFNKLKLFLKDAISKAAS